MIEMRMQLKILEQKELECYGSQELGLLLVEGR
jgi:hypothetical protein